MTPDLSMASQDTDVTPKESSSILKWTIAFAIASIVFVNHYCRDSVGALEVQLEDSILTVHEYHLLNSLFFIPNVFMPLVGGLLSMRLGAVHVLIICTFISAMGICLFTYGLYAGSIEWFFIGRNIVVVVWNLDII